MIQAQHIPRSFQFLFFFLFLILLLSTSFFMSQVKPRMAIGVAIAVGIFLISFLDTNVALCILILSMLLSPEFGQRTVTGQGMTLRMEDFLLLIVGFAWLAKNAYYKEQDELGLLRKTPLNPYIFGYIVACAASTAAGMIAGRVEILRGSLFVLKYFEYIIVYFIVVNNLHRESEVRSYASLLLLTCLIVCLVAIVQIPRGIRVSAPFEGRHGEPNTLGGYLVLMLSLVIGIFFAMGSLNQRAVLGTLGITGTVVLIYTLSRSSWLAFGASVLFLISFLKRKERLTALLFLIIALCLLFLIAPERAKKRVTGTFGDRDVSAGQVTICGIRLDQSTSARLYDWKNGLGDWISNHLILGYGVTGYPFMDAQYIRIAVEAGIIGLIAFILLMKAIFTHAWLSYKKVRTPLFKGLAIGYLAGFTGLLVHGIGTNTFVIVRIMEPFWFLTGMIMILPELEHNVLEGSQAEGG